MELIQGRTSLFQNKLPRWESKYSAPLECNKTVCFIIEFYISGNCFGVTLTEEPFFAIKGCSFIDEGST